MKQATVKIAKGNTKLGKIPNVSLPPVKSCVNCKECRKDCYALKAYRQYPSTRRRWNENYLAWQQDETKYFADIISQLERSRTKYFRWHVAGDIPTQSYLNGMIWVALALPKIKFLAFSKNYSLVTWGLPENLRIIWSAWPKQELPQKIWNHETGYRIAWLSTDSRKDLYRHFHEKVKCSGKCEDCLECFKAEFTDIVFDLH